MILILSYMIVAFKKNELDDSLRKAIRRAKFTYNELLTTVTEVEVILNSRPLLCIANDDVEEPVTFDTWEKSN